jgi:putative nucleotidyltransferase with HDIG domain
MTTDTNDLLAEVSRLPVHPGAAMRLLWMLEDPRTSAADLGRLIESDPALSMQAIRLANSAFYGLSGKVSSAWRAVTVLGFGTVKAMATTAAFDWFAEKGPTVPDEFWRHSVTTAAAAATLARRVGVQSNEAFSAGLLHDVGSILVARRSLSRPDTGDRQVTEGMAGVPTLTLVRAEIAEFAASHADVGAAAFRAMGFPSGMVEAIGAHHSDPRQVASPLGRLLIAADLLATTLDGLPPEHDIETGVALQACNIPAAAEHNLLEEIGEDQAHLAGFLSVSG